MTTWYGINLIGDERLVDLIKAHDWPVGKGNPDDPDVIHDRDVRSALLELRQRRLNEANDHTDSISGFEFVARTGNLCAEVARLRVELATIKRSREQEADYAETCHQNAQLRERERNRALEQRLQMIADATKEPWAAASATWVNAVANEGLRGDTLVQTAELRLESGQKPGDIHVDPALRWHDVGCVKRYNVVKDEECECEKRRREAL